MRLLISTSHYLTIRAVAPWTLTYSSLHGRMKPIIPDSILYEILMKRTRTLLEGLNTTVASERLTKTARSDCLHLQAPDSTQGQLTLQQSSLFGETYSMQDFVHASFCSASSKGAKRGSQYSMNTESSSKSESPCWQIFSVP